MKRIAFIINPISGTGKKNLLPQLLKEYLDHSKFTFEIIYTQYRGHGVEIAKQILEQEGFDIIGVVGGDGSINEIGRSILYSKVAMAIIPAGSGNGFARHFGIPCEPIEAIRYLNNAVIKQVDSGKINEHCFFATAGLGFDARVAHEFDQTERRGLFGYIKAIFQQLRKCKDIPYLIEFDKQKIEQKSFILTIANTSQYGNACTISPKSNASDGLLELVTLKKPSYFRMSESLFKLFRRNIDTYRDFSSISASEFKIHSENQKGHVDGDPIIIEKENWVTIAPKSLNLLIKS